MKSWYKKEHILVEYKGEHRPLPINMDILPQYWQEMFLKIIDYKEPDIRLLEGKDICIDIDGAIWVSPNKYCLDHHEPSEITAIMQRLVRWPKFVECFQHPRFAAGKLYRRLKQLFEGVRYETLPIRSKVLYFSDSRATGNFYHWTIESLSRLLLVEPFAKDSYLMLTEKQIKCDYIIASLKRLGIAEERLIPIRKGVRYIVSNLQVVTCSMYATGACSSSGVSLIQDKLSIITQKKPEVSLYIARKPTLGRSIVNQKEFIEVLKRYNIQTIYAEDYSFEEITALLANTKLLIGVYSAALTHVVFMPKGGHVIELASTKFIDFTPSYWDGKYSSVYAGYYYYSLSTACSLNYHLVPCTQKNETDYVLNADIYVDINILKESLKLFTNVENKTNLISK